MQSFDAAAFRVADWIEMPCAEELLRVHENVPYQLSPLEIEEWPDTIVDREDDADEGTLVCHACSGTGESRGGSLVCPACKGKGVATAPPEDFRI